MAKIQMTIDELNGATDVAHLEKALESVPHVKAVEIDSAAKRALVEHDGATEEELKTAVEALGYHVTSA
jgi:copper chaperone CopZ